MIQMTRVIIDYLRNGHRIIAEDLDQRLQVLKDGESGKMLTMGTGENYVVWELNSTKILPRK